jgi:hypothetical protein
MIKIKMVDENFKPFPIPAGVKERALLDEIEELKERLDEETKRADELFDKVEQFEKNNHPDYEVIDKYEYADIKRDEGILDNLVSLQEELTVARWRAELGIDNAKTEEREIIERMELLG